MSTSKISPLYFVICLNAGIWSVAGFQLARTKRQRKTQSVQFGQMQITEEFLNDPILRMQCREIYARPVIVGQEILAQTWRKRIIAEVEDSLHGYRSKQIWKSR